MDFEFAITTLGIKKYDLLLENQKMKREGHGHKGLSRLVFKENNELIKELQRAIKLLKQQ